MWSSWRGPGSLPWWIRALNSLVPIGLIAAGVAVFTLASTPDDAQGKDVFARRCGGCHALDIDKEGPRLRNVYGRQAGSVPGFGYSAGLKKLGGAGVQWNDATIDKWLADPAAMVPDTDMEFHLSDAAERRAVIAWLKSLREGATAAGSPDEPRAPR